MSTTIFCTFEQQDIADLAMGDLRNATIGIKSIHYVGGYNSRTNILNASTTNNSWGSVLPIRGTMEVEVPSRPVNVKIVCSDASAESVKSRLINLRAYQIITMR